MDIKKLTEKLTHTINKYKYAVIVLAVGLLLLMLPSKSKGNEPVISAERSNTGGEHIEIQALTEILESIQGAGEVRVLLSTASGEKTLYQTNTDTSVAGEETNTKTETVILTDSERNERGLVSQIIPQKYQGAIVVCQGADNSTVKLAITQAVAKITGLGADAICVLKMK